MFTVILIIAIVEGLIILGFLLPAGRKYDGKVVVTETETKKLFSLEDIDPDAWDQKKRIMLQVKTDPE